jgi:hypothetical protein
MAAVTVTASKVAPINETEYLAKTWIAGAAITAGQIVAFNASDKVIPAAGGTAVAAQAGVALRSVSAGSPVTCLIKGSVAGIDVSAASALDNFGLSGSVAGGWDSAVAGAGVALPIGNEPDITLWVDFTASWMSGWLTALTDDFESRIATLEE